MHSVRPPPDISKPIPRVYYPLFNYTGIETRCRIILPKPSNVRIGVVASGNLFWVEYDVLCKFQRVCGPGIQVGLSENAS